MPDMGAVSADAVPPPASSDEVAKLHLQVAELRAQVAERDAKLLASGSFEELTQTIRQLKEQLKESAASVAAQTATLHSFEVKIAALEQQVKGKDDIIALLTSMRVPDIRRSSAPSPLSPPPSQP